MSDEGSDKEQSLKKFIRAAQQGDLELLKEVCEAHALV